MIAFKESTLPEIKESVDFLNVMTYDLMNRRDKTTKHHSGMSGSDDALHLYSDMGFDLRHLNLGFGFYIKWFKTAKNETCDSLPAIGCRTELMEDPLTGADLGKAGAFSWHDEVPPELAESFERAMKNGVDDERKGIFEGHYYMDKQERLFWSWDTPSSISKKLRQLHRHLNEIGGVFAWGLGEDAPNFEHLKAVNEALAHWDDEGRANEHQEL